MKKLIVPVIVTLCAQSALATGFSNENDWRTAVGGVWSQENFEGFAELTGVTTLPSVGLDLDPLQNGGLATVRSAFSVGGDFHTGPNVLLNGPFFPGNGDATLRATGGGLIYALGYWNVGGDDRTTLAFHRADGSVIESIDTPSLTSNLAFQGIVSAEGAAYVTIHELSGNQWWSIDDLQVAAPAPGAGVLAGVGAFAGIARRRRAK